MKIAVSSGRAADLSTGKEIGPQMYGVAMLMDDGRIYASPYLSAPMEPAAPEPANVVDIAIGKAGLFSLDKGGRIYKWAARDGKPRAWRRDEVAKDVVGLTCDSGGNLWCVNKKGEMFMAEAEFAGLGAADTQYEPGPWTPMNDPSTAAFWGGSTWSYTVKSGDGLYEIIRSQYKVTDQPSLKRISDEIVRLNKLANENQISKGQVLAMPPKDFA